MTVDPETEGQLEFSPYHYSFNNPILYSDPDGRFPFVVPLLPAIGAAFAEGLAIAGEIAIVSGAAAALTELSLKVGANDSYSPAVSFARSAGGELTGGKVNANGSKQSSRTSSNASTTTGGDEDKKKRNKNSHDAEGNFVLYKVKDPSGKPLKVGKADSDRTNSKGIPVRVSTSERKAQKTHPGATATVIPGSQRSTTIGKMKEYEAKTVRDQRASGNELPLNKERDKRYRNNN